MIGFDSLEMGSK